MNDNDKQYYFDLVKGAIFGQAIGDALGHPIEFAKTHTVMGLEPDNKFTDDTQMFCAIGEAMLEAPPHIDNEKFMDVLAQKFIDWRSNPLGGSHRAPGNTCMEAVRKLGTGRHWRQTGKTAQGKGNGSAMRAGIIGARYWKSPAYAFRLGCLTSVPTHNNLEAILSSGMVAYLVAASIAGVPWAEAVGGGLELCSAFQNNVPDYPTNNVPFDNTRDGQAPWKVVMQFANGFVYGTGNIAADEFLRTNGNDFTAVPATAEAIYFNTRHDAFDEMVLDCANISDDSDTITAITGTIAGARFGFAGINEDWDEVQEPDWKQSIEMREYLESLSQRIFEASIEEDAPTKEKREVVATVERVLDVEEFGTDDDSFGDEAVDSITRAIDSGALDSIEEEDDEEFEVEF